MGAESRLGREIMSRLAASVIGLATRLYHGEVIVLLAVLLALVY